MTTNHPAHGPVSLDRLHQISEILSKAAAQSDGGNLGYAMADAVKVIDGVIATTNIEPVACIDRANLDYLADGCDGHVWATSYAETGDVLLYTTPITPAVPDEKRDDDGSVTSDFDHGWNACRAAMLQAGNFREIPNSSTNNCREIAETSTNEHEIETHTLLKSIEGMGVSVDVSTCDADAGHRYFGTVTEISELDTEKNGYILLVQDAKPNFKPAGNSPVIGIDLASEPDRSVEVRYFAPSGYVMVPVEPTMAMLDEFDSIIDYGAEDSKDAWSRLIAAAPKQE